MGHTSPDRIDMPTALLSQLQLPLERFTLHGGEVCSGDLRLLVGHEQSDCLQWDEFS